VIHSRIDAVIAVLATAVVATGLALIVIVANDIHLNPPSPTPLPTPFSSIPGFTMRGVLISDPSACKGCHVTGNVIALRPIPPLAHPLEGWRDCTACHASGRLVAVAPGHAGITNNQCLSCHALQGGSQAPPARPHHVYPGKQCTDCHGVNKQAPMPDLMTGRTACWLCHHNVPGLGTPEPGATAPATSSSASPGPVGRLPGPGNGVVLDVVDRILADLP
jgi:hypothetical protein